MLINGQEKCNYGITKSPSEDIYAFSNERGNQLAYKLVRGEGDGSFISPSEDELMEVEHLLADPKSEKVLGDDDFLYLNPENSEKCLEIGDFSFPDAYCQMKTNVGKLDSDSTQEGKHDTKFEFLDDMFQGIGEEGNLHGGDCVDYLLDTEFAEKNSVSDYGPCKVLGRSSLENNSTGLIEKGSGGSEFSNLSSPIIPISQSTGDNNAIFLDNMTIPELQEAFRSTFGRETTVKDEQWLKRRILFGLQNLIDFDNASCFSESQIGYNENEDDMIFTSNYHYSGRISSGTMVRREQNGCRDLVEGGFSEDSKIENGFLNMEDNGSALINRKRLRRPTRRYIEESSDVKSRHCSGRLETSTTSSRDKFVLLRSQNQHHRKGFEAVPLVCRPDSLGGSGIQVRRGRPKKNSGAFMGHPSKDNKERRLHLVMPERKSGLESSKSDSQDDMSDDCIATYKTEKGGIRRKHHRLWNLSEVMKLIEGVSRYGVGRWTDIKRLLFSSSVYRTSVDLKDKWRNLLRASGVQFQSKKMAEQRRKHPTAPMPQSVLRRVRELAVIYPYPRERKSKHSHAVSTPVTVAAVNGSDASISRSGRILHRKNFM